MDKDVEHRAILVHCAPEPAFHANGISRLGSKRIGFVLVPRFSMVTLGCAIEPFRLANEYSIEPRFCYYTISVRESLVSTSDKIGLCTSRSLRNCGDLDVIFIVSSLNAVDFRDKELESWVRQQARSGAVVAPLGSAAVLAARTGILDGYRCVTHWQLLDRVREAFPLVDWAEALYCIDRDRWTSGGGFGAFDLSLAIVKQTDVEYAQLGAEVALHTRLREAAEHQRMATKWRFAVTDERLVRVLNLMESKLESPVTLEALAQAARLSCRQLERLCDRNMGRRPMQIYRAIRLQHARELLRTSTLALSEIALRCGFADLSHFIRQYRRVFGETPARTRRRNNE